MNLDLSDEEGKALAVELDAIVRNDRYPLSTRIQLLKAILAKLRPEPVREPLPEPKRYLCRIPFVHIGSEPWGEDHMQFISRLEPDHREAK